METLLRNNSYILRFLSVLPCGEKEHNTGGRPSCLSHSGATRCPEDSSQMTQPSIIPRPRSPSMGKGLNELPCWCPFLPILSLCTCPSLTTSPLGPERLLPPSYPLARWHPSSSWISHWPTRWALSQSESCAACMLNGGALTRWGAMCSRTLPTQRH